MNQDAGGTESGGNQAPQEGQPMDQMSVAGDGKKSMGPMMGIIIIVIVIVLGGAYYFFTQNQNGSDEITTEEITAQEDDTLTALQEQGTSDEIADIEADLNFTDLEGLDAELEDIEKELSF